jgi:DNA-binding transcriptional LysR family regulator
MTHCKMEISRLIDSRQLHIFQAVASTGSFTRAARKLFLTQSGVSHAIKTLEKDLGCTLVRRQGRKINLTEAGEHLREEGFDIIQNLGLLRAELEDSDRWGKDGSRLRLAGNAKICQELLPAVLGEFHESFPLCRIEVYNMSTPDAIDFLLKGRVDLAISLRPEKEERLETLDLYEDELQVAVYPGHEWAKFNSIELSDIPKQNFILPSRSSYTFRAIRGYFKKLGMPMSSFVEISSTEAIVSLIRSGLGIGLLPLWTAWEEVERSELVLLPLPGPEIRRHWGISYCLGRSLNAFEKTFAGLAKKFCLNSVLLKPSVVKSAT